MILLNFCVQIFVQLSLNMQIMFRLVDCQSCMELAFGIPGVNSPMLHQDDSGQILLIMLIANWRLSVFKKR